MFMFSCKPLWLILIASRIAIGSNLENHPENELEPMAATYVRDDSLNVNI